MKLQALKMRWISRLHWFIDHPSNHRVGVSPHQSRILTYQAIENVRGNNFLVILVAGIGFFTDSYLLFASNAILPMLDYVYWNDVKNLSHETAINSATLAGCIVGMVLFGILADRFGRRKMYGIELIILIVGTIGVVMSSSGYENSMDVQSWFIWWRFVSGVGLGGDYPLSAVIVSEFAPTKRRARILASVFSMQAFGALAATLVSIVVIAIARSLDPQPSQRTVDQMWRWVVGLSLIPATFAVVVRLAIPESPRFTLDVLDDPFKAFDEANRFKQANLQGELELRADLAIANEYTSFGSAEEQSTNNQYAGGIAALATRHSQQEFRQPAQLTIWHYFVTEGNWRYLLSTAVTWFLLDFNFFGLGLNSPWTISKIWYIIPENVTPGPTWNTDYTNPDADIYDILTQNGLHSLVLVSIGAVIGSIGLIAAVDHFSQRRLQWVMFLVLGILFVIVGATFQATVQTQFHGVTMTLYVICQMCFYFGPNGLTFIIPAQLFPTKYRATCHGLSAAAGKLGSVVVQLFLAYVKFDVPGIGKEDASDPNAKWLGYVLLVFAVPMFLGAMVTKLCLPELQAKGGESFTLEQLAEGRKGLCSR